jgi:hypothetical protein
MTILYRMRPDGAFLAGCTDTGHAGYCYPTSPGADAARKDPITAARYMVKNDMAWTRPKSGQLADELTARDARYMAELAEHGTAI